MRSRSESFRVDPWVDESTHDKRSFLALPLLESPLHYSKQLHTTDFRKALTHVDSTTRLHPHGDDCTYLSYTHGVDCTHLSHPHGVGRTHLSHPHGVGRTHLSHPRELP